MASTAVAATPPGLSNYERVLRDSATWPLDGTYRMTFRFVDDSSGDEILVDTHRDAPGSKGSARGSAKEGRDRNGAAPRHTASSGAELLADALAPVGSTGAATVVLLARKSTTIDPTATNFPGAWLPVAEPVEAGDVLAVDTEREGVLRRARDLADPGVVGVAAAPSDGDHAAVTFSGVVECKVDAGYGAIRTGDLLTTSPTPGHAMRALDARPGTILGKALGTADAGTGTIRILVAPR